MTRAPQLLIFVPRIFGKFPTLSGIQHTTKPWEIPRIFDRSWSSIWPVSEAHLASLCRLLYALSHLLFCMPPQPRNSWLLPSSFRQSMPQEHKGKLKFCERNSANSSLQRLARLTSGTGQIEDQNRSKIHPKTSSDIAPFWGASWEAFAAPKTRKSSSERRQTKTCC